MHLYEDLVALNKSERYLLSVESMSSVLNVQNKRKGIAARHGVARAVFCADAESPRPSLTRGFR
jgi:hypothetical protein